MCRSTCSTYTCQCSSANMVFQFCCWQVFDLFDLKQNGVIEFGEFVRSLSVFHPNASLEEKVACKYLRCLLFLKELGFLDWNQLLEDDVCVLLSIWISCLDLVTFRKLKVFDPYKFHRIVQLHFNSTICGKRASLSVKRYLEEFSHCHVWWRAINQLSRMGRSSGVSNVAKFRKLSTKKYFTATKLMNFSVKFKFLVHLAGFKPLQQYLRPLGRSRFQDLTKWLVLGLTGEGNGGSDAVRVWHEIIWWGDRGHSGQGIDGILIGLWDHCHFGMQECGHVKSFYHFFLWFSKWRGPSLADFCGGWYQTGWTDWYGGVETSCRTASFAYEKYDIALSQVCPTLIAGYVFLDYLWKNIVFL